MTRLAVIKKDKCNSARCNKECVNVCPINRGGKDCVFIGEDKKSHIVEPVCTGCGLCIKACPFKAINVINLMAQLKEDPIHRYGENGFELFRLPIPQQNQIVGLLGTNGVGKSTALKILAGLLKPNLGKYKEEPDYSSVISAFKGTELQAYFKKLSEKKVKVAYKPQYIDAILSTFKGKAVDLLCEFGNKTKAKELASSLGITKILDRDVKNLSGGELQKVAIATALMKDADLYFFDEPSSYLDIKERINVAKVLCELIAPEGKKSGKSMLAVEHDLIILDYLADVIHIFYGEEATYGVVTHPISARNGINTYLNGYLSDENIRFRPEPIKFYLSAKDQKIDYIPLIEWPALTKKLGSFYLEIKPSTLMQKEVVGVIGANAVGKTTFMKMLAGLEKPDSGKLAHKVKISYKPQHVGNFGQAGTVPEHTKHATSDTKDLLHCVKPEKVSVREVLASISKKFASQQFKLDVIQPLQLEKLMDSNLSELSGGELQSVAIAACLLREADLYLLDEPSTYLDVEQRLRAAKAIQKTIKDRAAAALVIDHDLLFISYLSDRVMVFDGKPSVSGTANEIQNIKDGMNAFLKSLNITMRKDPETGRPRVNKLGSQKDQEQKKKGQYYA